MEVLIDNDKATLKVYPEKGIVHHKIKDFIYGDDFRDLMMTGAEAMEEHDCTKWLSDDRGSSALRDEDEKWGQEVWEPRILEAGWEHWALVLPEKTIGKMNMEELSERYSELGVNVKTFTDSEEALEWLEEQ